MWYDNYTLKKIEFQKILDGSVCVLTVVLLPPKTRAWVKVVFRVKDSTILLLTICQPTSRILCFWESLVCVWVVDELEKVLNCGRSGRSSAGEGPGGKWTWCPFQMFKRSGSQGSNRSQ